jgi:hypothetical protein
LPPQAERVTSVLPCYPAQPPERGPGHEPPILYIIIPVA